MAHVATPADYPLLLSLWTANLPALDAAYGAANVNHARTAADLASGVAAGEEFWLSTLGDAYFAMRPGILPDGTAAWEFFEACFTAAARVNPRWKNVSKEMLLAVRSRGLALGYQWAFCRTSALLAAASQTRLAAVQLLITRESSGLDLRVFDLNSFVVA